VIFIPPSHKAYQVYLVFFASSWFKQLLFMEKQWKMVEYDLAVAEKLQVELGIPNRLCALLAQRGITTFNEAKVFFRPKLEDLHDPFLMKNMQAAVDRILKAIAEGETILLYGDYDVDGTTAIATLFAFLQPLHSNLIYYIPDRYKEGYGVSFEGIEHAVAQQAGLMITLDCGIKAVEQLREAKRQSIDVIVCDHHLPDDELPEALAILDPKQTDCPYPFKELSGCGIALKLAQALAQELQLQNESWQRLLDFVVVSIASDIVPITGENRILAHYGLRQLNRTKYPGLKALIAHAGKQPPLTISDIVFGLGPLVNAAGRLADAEQAVRLLLATDKKVAADQVRVLTNRNKLRKEFDQRMLLEARVLVQNKENWEAQKSIVLFQPHWHKGIVGITAARLVEEFHKPTIVLTESEGKIVGSARSVQGFNIHEAIGRCETLLYNFGGHQHAAGLTLIPGNITAFQIQFENTVQAMIVEESLQPQITIAAELPLQELTSKFWRILQQFAPFGPGNRNPVFVSRCVKDTGYSRPLRGNHLRLSIKQDKSPVFQGIAFNMGQMIDTVIQRKPFHICYTIEQNNWKGRRQLQLVIKDIQLPE